jgi:CBS domain-containing protein
LPIRAPGKGDASCPIEMKAGELCTRRTVTADPEESVIEAARRMTRENVGDLVVVEDIGGKMHPIGIVTDRDLVTGALVLAERALTLQVRDVIQRELVTACEDDPVEAVLAKLKRHQLRRMPIVDQQGVLQGVLTLDDIVEWIREQIDDASAVLQAAMP